MGAFERERNPRGGTRRSRKQPDSPAALDISSIADD
jgi:hypothetical protein